MADETVIDALLAALESNPDDNAIRTHVASLLLTANRIEEAYSQATQGLRLAPADEQLLALACEAAERSDRHTEADGYRALLEAIKGVPVEPHTEPPHDDSPDIPETADALIATWAASDALDEPDVGFLSRSDLLLKDVGGMDEVKERLELSFLGPLRNPELRTAFGKTLGGGLLLWGPPGCGKTFLARALAGELGANFYEVGISDVLDMWMGSSERNLHSVFEVARRNTPCVLFFDEIDALGMRRSQIREGGSAIRGVVNQLLLELDGASSNNDGIFVLAATNHPWDVDPALMRPGRFDRKLLVLPPDRAARVAIATHHLKGRPVKDLNLNRLADKTEGLSGADLALVCDQATEVAMEASSRSGKICPISMKDLLRSAKEVQPSISGWLQTAKNHATFSNDNGTYDELLAYLRGRR